MAASDHNRDRGSVGCFYRVERMVGRFCPAFRSHGCSGFRAGDREGQPSGNRGISVLSDPGGHRRMYSHYSCMDGDRSVQVSFRDLFRRQFPGAGGTVYLPEEKYASGISEKTENVKA